VFESKLAGLAPGHPDLQSIFRQRQGEVAPNTSTLQFAFSTSIAKEAGASMRTVTVRAQILGATLEPPSMQRVRFSANRQLVAGDGPQTIVAARFIPAIFAILNAAAATIAVISAKRVEGGEAPLDKDVFRPRCLVRLRNDRSELSGSGRVRGYIWTMRTLVPSWMRSPG
jgi:hypothetical protein